MINLIETVLLFSMNEVDIKEFQDYIKINYSDFIIRSGSEQKGNFMYKCLLENYSCDIEEIMIS